MLVEGEGGVGAAGGEVARAGDEVGAAVEEEEAVVAWFFGVSLVGGVGEGRVPVTGMSVSR